MWNLGGITMRALSSQIHDFAAPDTASGEDLAIARISRSRTRSADRSILAEPLTLGVAAGRMCLPLSCLFSAAASPRLRARLRVYSSGEMRESLQWCWRHAKHPQLSAGWV